MGMSAAAPVPDPAPGPPPSDPQAIRAALPPGLAAEFDREWELVLERAKQSMDLSGVPELVGKWRHTVYQERREPGSYERMLARAEQILRTGHNPDAGSFEDMQALIRARLGR